MAPTPPSHEPTLIVPDRGSPGLFGPRSPRDSTSHRIGFCIFPIMTSYLSAADTLTHEHLPDGDAPFFPDDSVTARPSWRSVHPTGRKQKKKKSSPVSWATRQRK
jgi:hypothetical protein